MWVFLNPVVDEAELVFIQVNLKLFQEMLRELYDDFLAIQLKPLLPLPYASFVLFKPSEHQQGIFEETYVENFAKKSDCIL